MRGKPRLDKLTDKAGNLLSPYWYICWREGKPSKPKRKSTGYTIGEGDNEANLALASFILERERPLAKEPNELLIGQVLRDYYEEHGKYLQSHKNILLSEKKLNAFFISQNVMRVSQIRPSIMNQYFRLEKERGQSNGTMRRDGQVLSCALNHEVREGRLTYAPKFKLPPAPPARDRYLTQEEKDRLYAACKHERTKHFIKIMLNTAQRPGAVEQLTWFQVDFENRIIHFDKDGKEKTNKLKRPVAMNSELYDLLTELFKNKETGYVLGHPGKARKGLSTAIKNAKLEGVSRYTLRHTTIDRINDRADGKTASDIGGHTSEETTRREYIKTKLEKQRPVMEGLWK